MKLSEIILETKNSASKQVRRSTETSMLEAIDFIRSNCSEITAVYKKSNNVRLYRGIPASNAEFKFGDTSIRTRKSRNTENYYTIIMDNDPLWKSFPKRSESFICSSDPSYASDYGTLYLVFPVNGTKIGQCPSKDIWDISEDKTNEMLDEVNTYIAGLARTSRIGLSEVDYKLFKTNLKKIQDMFDKDPDSVIKKMDTFTYNRNFNNKMKSLLKQNDNNFYKMFLDIISPKDFKLWTTKNFDVHDKHECWFSGNCIFVNARTPIKMGKDEDWHARNKDTETKNMNINEFIKAL